MKIFWEDEKMLEICNNSNYYMLNVVCGITNSSSSGQYL